MGRGDPRIRHQGAMKAAAERRRSMRKLMVAVALAMIAGLAGAQAQTFPSRPLTLVRALPAGGAVDALARVMVEHMRGTLGQPVIIENMGGAGGTLSIARVGRSASAGYTIRMGTPKPCGGL